MINTEIMNECLMVKWIWKIEKGSDETWFQLLKAKYMPNGGFFTSKNRGTSQFWRSLHKVKHLFKWGAIYKAKGGRNVGFWDDVWIGNTPLRIQFPHLHKMSSFPLARASEYWKDGGWSIDFRRSLTISERASWEELENSLPTSLVDDERDEVVWALDRTKVFSTKSLYSFLSNRGVCVKESDNIWKTKVPLKIKFFLWQIENDRLPTASALKKRGWRGSHLCCLCGRKEDVNHVLFRCSMARFIWCGVREALAGKNIPTSWKDWRGLQLVNEFKLPKRFTMFLFSGLAWALWKTRNKMAIEHIYPTQAMQVLHLGVSFMQKWRPLLKASDQEKMKEVVDRLKHWAMNFCPSVACVSDIEEI